MSTTIEDLIAKLEAETQTARDAITMHEAQITAFQRVILKNVTVLDALHTALESSAAAQVFADEAPAPAPEPAKEVRTEPSPLPTAVGANGFDRAALRRQLKQWHIRYPLGTSHRAPSQMMRQALRATILDHEGFREDWLAKGGTNFGDANTRSTVQEMRDAATILGIDADAVTNAAHKVQRLFLHYGVAGVDHHWDVSQ